MKQEVSLGSEWKRYSTSLIDTRTVKDSILHPLKVKISSNEQIAEIIVHAIFMIGLPKDNIPDGSNMDLLITFIRENYLNYSLAEFKLAFTMAAKGELETDCKHYGSFSPEYFGRIMKAYSEQHRLKTNAELSKKINALPEPIEPTEIEKERIRKEFEQLVIIPIYKKYLETKKIELGYTPIKFIYNNLCEFHRIIDFTSEQKIIIHQKAKKNFENNLLLSYSNNQREVLPYKIRESVLNLKKNDKNNIEIIKDECYFICVLEVFEKLSNENVQIETVLNCEL
jgi:hypothetical protein